MNPYPKPWRARWMHQLLAVVDLPEPDSPMMSADWTLARVTPRVRPLPPRPRGNTSFRAIQSGRPLGTGPPPASAWAMLRAAQKMVGGLRRPASSRAFTRLRFRGAKAPVSSRRWREEAKPRARRQWLAPRHWRKHAS